MLGTIVKINSQIATYALKTDTGYSIFKAANMLNSTIGDLIEFDNVKPLGRVSVTNKTRNTTLDVEFSEHNISAGAAQSRLFPQ